MPLLWFSPPTDTWKLGVAFMACDLLIGVSLVCVLVSRNLAVPPPLNRWIRIPHDRLRKILIGMVVIGYCILSPLFLYILVQRMSR